MHRCGQGRRGDGKQGKKIDKGRSQKTRGPEEEEEPERSISKTYKLTRDLKMQPLEASALEAPRKTGIHFLFLPRTLMVKKSKSGFDGYCSWGGITI